MALQTQSGNKFLQSGKNVEKIQEDSPWSRRPSHRYGPMIFRLRPRRRKHSHEEVPPLGPGARFCPRCVDADHRRQQRGRSTGASQASPSPPSSSQASPLASPSSPPPSPQEGGTKEGLIIPVSDRKAGLWFSPEPVFLPKFAARNGRQPTRAPAGMNDRRFQSWMDRPVSGVCV